MAAAGWAGWAAWAAWTCKHASDSRAWARLSVRDERGLAVSARPRFFCKRRRLQNLLRRFCKRRIQKPEFSIQNCNPFTGNVFYSSDSCLLTYNFKLPRGIVLVVVLVLDFRGRGRGRGRKTTRIFISSYPLVSSRRSRAAGCILTSLLQTPQRGFCKSLAYFSIDIFIPPPHTMYQLHASAVYFSDLFGNGS
jgi:hypothetical protein